jgi:hypothetical protein
VRPLSYNVESYTCHFTDEQSREERTLLQSYFRFPSRTVCKVDVTGMRVSLLIAVGLNETCYIGAAEFLCLVILSLLYALHVIRPLYNYFILVLPWKKKTCLYLLTVPYNLLGNKKEHNLSC